MSLTRSNSLQCWPAILAISVALQAGTASTAASQVSSADAHRPEATRAELEALSSTLQQRLSTPGNQTARDSVLAAEVQSRLRDGDFHSGDQIVLRVQGEPLPNDTLTVGDEKSLPMSSLADLSLKGVLRSELRERVREHLARYLRDPQFSVTPLIRVAVVGEVTRPGFYTLSPDARVTDAVMLAGGPTPNGDLNRLELSRNGQPRASEEEMREIVARGLSLHLAGVTAGDALVVPQRKRRDPQIYFQAGTVLLTAVSTFFAWSAISRRH